MSLGGDACTTAGVDPDTTEGAAVADAIAANIVVVAAAGNSGTEGVNAPGCDTGVIAVGATGLADGTTNGTNSNGSATSPTEYVASYTDYGSPGAAVNSSSAWGIVAPGGDPSGDNDLDDLHWIENIWTTTPYMANGNDTSFEGSCAGDYPTQSGTVDCRVLIAGTSMATPHVAGAAALIISVNSGYQSPTQMKQLLCQTADDISDSNEGCGRLNVYRAMASALGDGTPPTPRPIP
jgi:subtilisin family serine protease